MSPRPRLFEDIARAGYNHLAERSDTYPGGYPDRVMATTGDMMDRNPELLKAFLRGIIRGYRFVRDERNQELLNRIVMDYDWEKELGWDHFDKSLQGSFGTQPATPAPSTSPAPPTSKTTPEEKATPRITGQAGAATLQPQTPAPARPSESPYYQGKTIELIAQEAAGGGTDIAARVSAQFFTKYIPGNPRIIVRNVPGGGGAVAHNIFYGTAKPDGLTLLQSSSGPISLQLSRRDIVKYDLTKYRIIGSIARAGTVLMIRKGVRGLLTDPKAKPLVVATKEGAETWQGMPMWGREFLGWNVRWIAGFGGTNEIELAFRRGEVDIFATSNAFIINRLMQDGVSENLCQGGDHQGGKFLRRVDFPDVPTFEQVLGDKKPSGIPWQAYIGFIGPLALDKHLVAPPGTPDRIVSVLTGAFSQMAKDPKFDELVKKSVSELYTVGIGQEVEVLMKQILEAPLEALDYTLELQRKFGVIK